MLELPRRAARNARGAATGTARALAARRRVRRDLLPFGFIAGSPHSGATLLARILSEHSAVFAPAHDTEAFAGGPRHAWPIVARLLAEARAEGKTFVVEKTPRHVERIELIRRMLPGSRFVLTVRDGRDVAASIGRRFGGDFGKGLDWWLSAARKIVAALGSADVLVARYEDFVLDPAQRVEAICTFLGLAFEPEMLDYHAREKPWGEAALPRIRSAAPAHQAHALRRQTQSNSPVFDARGAWRGVLPDRWAEAFLEEPARSLMLQLGYDPAR